MIHALLVIAAIVGCLALAHGLVILLGVMFFDDEYLP